MSRFTMLFLLAVILVVAVHPTQAATFAVGSCKPSLPSYANISAAVADVPSGSTVQVCPGTYPEQVKIDKGLTLQGISSGNSAASVLTMPTGGFVQNTTSQVFALQPVAAQLLVESPDPVNVTNLTVDGSGGSGLGLSGVWLAGIFYKDSSGTVSRVTTRNQIDPCGSFNKCGMGIVAVNGGSSSTAVTIQNSSVQDADSFGIYAAVADTKALVATIKANSVFVSAEFGIFDNVDGTVIGNLVTASFAGIATAAGTVSISSNTVTNTPRGIQSSSGTSIITSNKIGNASDAGILLFKDGTTVRSNSITEAGSGIDFFCNSGIVSHNTINDAGNGISNVPSATVSPNNYFNVGTIRTGGC